MPEQAAGSPNTINGVSNSSYRVFTLWMLFFFMFAMDNGNRQQTQPSASVGSLLDLQRNFTSELQNATFAENHTDVSEIMPILDNLHDLTRFERLRTLYTNITGLYRGSYAPFNLTAHHVNQSQYYNETTRNRFLSMINPYASGVLSGTLFSNATVAPGINLIEGQYKLRTTYFENSLKWWTMPNSLTLSIAGLHWIETGVVWMVAVPQGYTLRGRDIMKMALNDKAFNESRAIAVSFSKMREAELLKYIEEGTNADEEDDSKKPAMSTCMLYNYMQLRPVPGLDGQSALTAYEYELAHPTGISLPSRPPNLASAFMYSPTCGLALSLDEIQGLKLELYQVKSVRYAMMMVAVTLVELVLTLIQIDYSRGAPSSLSKVSLMTMGMSTIMDAYLCLLNLTTGAVFTTVFLPFVTVAFLKFVLFCIFEMRYLLTISRSQRRERDHSVFGPLFSRTYLYLFGGLFLFCQIAARITMFMGVAGFLINATHNSRRAFQTYYVLGISVVRLVPALYIFGCPLNVVTFEDAEPIGVIALITYVALQCAILHLQEFMGPRFFVPTGWLPQTYDYHPVLNGGSDLESLPNSTGPLESPTVPSSRREDTAVSGHGHPRLTNHDCPICFLPVNIRPPRSSGPSNPLEGEYGRYNYMSSSTSSASDHHHHHHHHRHSKNHKTQRPHKDDDDHHKSHSKSKKKRHHDEKDKKHKRKRRHSEPNMSVVSMVEMALGGVTDTNLVSHAPAIGHVAHAHGHHHQGHGVPQHRAGHVGSEGITASVSAASNGITAAVSAAPVSSGRRPVSRPQTKEEHVAQQSVVRDVLDPYTGRMRKIKGSGEVIESIVSREQHREINRLATRGDGMVYMATSQLKK
ncbi:hypothetical protein SmJEL517_g04747 [Synchytrium microbalum]|uniref:ADP-ribosylation factor-like protein 6-interacting protein 4 n=1 Tax=Synchytrium microbalum TaxID=1806994 RepID=A0A507BY40_9FUNG|nr:uncharacterized protein SmJEL517_g04747 [Synchytrium microbalum]TPX32031.1 hypothetical protein SmJEL517_g04747 [Synchytrium microbalum]